MKKDKNCSTHFYLYYNNKSPNTNLSNKHLHFGLTLVEILIALVVIGVVAAITFPIFFNTDTKQNEYRAGMQKAYTVVNQALYTNKALKGTPLTSWDNGWDEEEGVEWLKT